MRAPLYLVRGPVQQQPDVLRLARPSAQRPWGVFWDGKTFEAAAPEVLCMISLSAQQPAEVL